VRKLLVLVIVIGAVAAFLYVPRAGAVVSAANAATLAILNTAIDGSRSGGTFAPALDGEVYKSGDLVRANTDGRAVLTFFDGSSLSVDPGSQVKVLALNRVPGDGIQASVEQTLGRSWSAVQKLKTPDSRYEVKTPSTTAVVRGTAFLTLVQQLPAGGTQTTYQVDDGTLQVTANAGGTVTVAAGTQVTIAEGAQAPASATPIPASPRIEVTSSAGLSFLAISPSGAACGPFGTKAEIFGCVATPNKIVIRDPTPGRWGFFLTTPTAGAPVLTVEVFGGNARNAGQSLSRPFKAADQVRTGLTLSAGPPAVLSAFEDAVVVNSLCAASAPGRVFASGDVGARLDAVRAFSVTNRAAPVSVVYTEGELNQAMTTTAPTGQGVTLSNTKIKIDQAGIHGTARAQTQVLTVDASADIVAGPVGDKFSLRVSRISADPLPPGLMDIVKGVAENGTAAFGDAMPFKVRQVSFHDGCFFVAGVTPG